MPGPIDPRQFLCVELQRLDLLLHREILRLRARYQLSLDEFRGLYISDEQVGGDSCHSRHDPPPHGPAWINSTTTSRNDLSIASQVQTRL